MKLKTLYDTPPWEWPAGADRFLLAILRNRKAKMDDRLGAADLAGEFEVINDELALALIGIAGNSAEAAELRCEAVLSLGLALENCDIFGYEEEYGDEEPLLSRAVFERISLDLQKLFMDTGTPDELRRCALETSVCAPQAWHIEAVRTAFASKDPHWQVAAAFCMNFLEGFEMQIMEALLNPNPDVHYQAVCAAGEWGVEDAWKHMVALVQNPDTDKELLLAAIDAVGIIRPHAALGVLYKLLDSDDEEINAAVCDVLIDSGAMAELEADTYEADDYLADDDWDDVD